MKEEEEKVAKGRVASECLECVKNQTSVWSISHTKYTLNWADPPAGSHYTLLYYLSGADFRGTPYIS